jgi:hypothetical protein
MPLARNNRIMGANFLNQSCAFDARLESILLADPPQNPFSTASVISDRLNRRPKSTDVRFTADCVAKLD